MNAHNITSVWYIVLYRIQHVAISCTVFEEISSLLNIAIMNNDQLVHSRLWGAVIILPLDNLRNYTARGSKGGNITLREYGMQLREHSVIVRNESTKANTLLKTLSLSNKWLSQFDLQAQT